jgi:hypothetical protein
VRVVRGGIVLKSLSGISIDGVGWPKETEKREERRRKFFIQGNCIWST